MTVLTIDSLIDILHQWRQALPGDTPVAHAMDDEGNSAELLGEAQPGFLMPPEQPAERLGWIASDDDIDGLSGARRCLVLWPYIPDAQEAQ